ncbi:glycosyltransferase family 4 protein [Vibrio breoganii]
MYDRYILMLANCDNKSPIRVAVEQFLEARNKFRASEVKYVKAYRNELPFRVEAKKTKISDVFKYKSSILHSHGLFADIYICFIKFFYRKNIKSITTIHSILTLDIKETYGTLSSLILPFYYYLLKFFDEIIVLSDSAKNDLICNMGEQYKGKITVIPNGIGINPKGNNCLEPKIFDELSKLSISYKLVFSVSVLREMKGIQYLMRAISENEQLYLIIFGDGPYKESLLQLSRDLNIHDRTLFLGHVLEPSQYFQFADSFILVSDYEGFPMSLLEAVSHKVPCVVSSDDLFDNYFPNDCIYRANRNAADEFADVIFKACFDSSERKKLAFDYLLENYQIKNLADKYFEVLEREIP